MNKDRREGAMYAKHVERVSPTGAKPIENVVINAKVYIGTVWGKLLQRNLSSRNLFSKKSPILKTTISSIFLNNGNKLVKRLSALIIMTLQNFLLTAWPALSEEKLYTKLIMKILH